MQKVSKPVNRVKVKIYGEDYYVRGSAPSDYIKKVAAYLDQKIAELSESHSHLSTTRMAVLAALNITDELFRLNEEYEEFLSLIDSETKGWVLNEELSSIFYILWYRRYAGNKGWKLF